MNRAATSLPEDVALFIQDGLSMTVASRDERLVPSISKAVGCRVSDDRREVTVFMYGNVAEPVVRDIARFGLVTVVFSRPSTNRTVQIKGRNAVFVPVQPTDVALVRRHLALLSTDLGTLGWDPSFVEAAFWQDPTQLIAVRFLPDLAYQQTPGPGAGQALTLPMGSKP